ncbi:unnamed protein product [Clavelina lepadiformis]|uniref:Uncharacterized protein n=1 Tax=Clavelina lepadiformis TaxID=159417 RepID=A0ABP0FNB4_CLALP
MPLYFIPPKTRSLFVCRRNRNWRLKDFLEEENCVEVFFTLRNESKPGGKIRQLHRENEEALANQKSDFSKSAFPLQHFRCAGECIAMKNTYDTPY